MNNKSVRISIPASVASDLGSFQKSLANIAERLGCRGCFSGADCFFQIERDLVINEKLEISPASVSGPRPEPWLGSMVPVPWLAGALASNLSRVALNPQPLPPLPTTVTLASEVSFDLAKVQESVAKIAGRLGCTSCCSGFDISFRHELDFMIDANLNVQTRGGSF